MRILILLISNRIKIFLVILICFNGYVFPQWVNNPSLNTIVVVDGVKPINITSIEDLKGGAFIFWEDNKNGLQNDILFSHLDGNGKVSFRADGKKVSELSGTKTNPVTAANLPNTAVVVWKDYTRSRTGNLFAQKVFGNGNVFWNKNGIQISSAFPDIYDYSVASDDKGFVYIAYMVKVDTGGSNYQLKYQKLDSNGKLLYLMDANNVYTSPFRKISSSIIADDKGGAFVFWLETEKSKTNILCQHIDSTGKPLLGKKPMVISNPQHSVITYSVKKTDLSSIYIAWQIQKTEKEIYHQLVTITGKANWPAGGKLATTQKGNKSNPQVLAADSTLILSWTNELNENKDIYLQKYTTKGAPRWKEDVAVIKQKYDQFGQKLLSDGKAGAIISWVDKRKISSRPNVYAQRISAAGRIMWDSAGVVIASHENTEKSYQSLISDLRGGAIAVFKENREGRNGIYAQKVFNTGTYISQIIGLNASLTGESVKISWYSANEASETLYDIEKSIISESGSSPWSVIGTLNSNGVSSAKYYEFFDNMKSSGTVYYRIVQKDNAGSIQPSDVVKIDLLTSSEKIVVGQNSPNPFTDETSIPFYMPYPGYVKIEFYNSHVEKIQETDSKYYMTGENKIPFTGKGLQAGIYFFRFTCGDFVDVKKMIVTK